MTLQQQKKIEAGREYRSMVLTVRAADQEDADSDSMIVEGYATTFDQRYLLYEWEDYQVFEQVARAAFDGCDMSDVIMQYDHQGRVFARNKNGTLTLTVDSHGLKVTANLAGTDIGRQLYQEIKGGYTDKMSFGFIVAEDTRTQTDDHTNNKTIVVRTITKIKKLYDVSAVSLPANDMTEISARKCADGVIQGMRAERLEAAHRKLALKLKLEGVPYAHPGRNRNPSERNRAGN